MNATQIHHQSSVDECPQVVIAVAGQCFVAPVGEVVLKHQSEQMIVTTCHLAEAHIIDWEKVAHACTPNIFFFEMEFERAWNMLVNLWCVAVPLAERCPVTDRYMVVVEHGFAVMPKPWFHDVRNRQIIGFRSKVSPTLFAMAVEIRMAIVEVPNVNIKDLRGLVLVEVIWWLAGGGKKTQLSTHCWNRPRHIHCHGHEKHKGHKHAYC